MGVYIPNMEMPKSCVYRKNGHLITCPLYDIDGYCGALNTEAIHKENGKLSDCPLVPVPPHGDLIARDALLKKCELVCTDDDEDIRAVRYSIIENAPAIIEPEEVET